MEYDDYEKEVEENKKRNKKFLKEFEKWLKEKNLSEKTIRNHVSNADLYINDYLTYYEVTHMEDGLYSVDSFLSNWFIRKCMWASRYSVKTTSASIKKFYQCMSEKKYVNKEDYKKLCTIIKESMPNVLKAYDEYEKECEDELYGFIW